MSAVEVTQADRVCADRIAGWSKLGDLKKAEQVAARHRHQSTSPLIDAMREAEEAMNAVKCETMGEPVGGGDGNTYVVRPLSGATYNRIVHALANLQAAIQRAEGEG